MALDLTTHQFNSSSCLSRIVYQANLGDLEQFTNFLTGLGINVDYRDSSDYTPLMVATERNLPLAVSTLVAAGADVNATVSRDNHTTPVMIAAERGHKDCLLVLLQAGAEVAARRHDQESPLTLAVRNKHFECIDHLLKYAPDERYTSRSRRSTEVPPHNIAAISHNTLSESESMNEPNSKSSHIHSYLVNFQNKDGKTALILASELNCFKACQTLIFHHADVNIRDNEGRTALMYSAQNNNRAICKLLIDNKADVNIQDNEGRTALIYSAQYNNWAICELLIDNMTDVNIRDNSGRTALMYGVLNSCFAFILKVDTICKEQLQSAMVPLLENGDRCFKRERVSSLLRRGANPVLETSQRSLLTILFTSPPSKGNFICVGNYSEEPPSMHTLSDEPELLRMFVCNGFFTETQLSKYSSPFQFAILNPHHDVIRYLIAICYLTSSDMKLISKHAAQRDELLIYSKCCNPLSDMIRRNKIKNKNLFREAISQPWPLVKLAFVAVSSALGFGSNREHRIRQTGLPPRLQRMLMFQEPASLVPVSEWSDIPLCFDPVEYERLPNPRPLLYYWPCGRDIVSDSLEAVDKRCKRQRTSMFIH